MERIPQSYAVRQAPTCSIIHARALVLLTAHLTHKTWNHVSRRIRHLGISSSQPSVEEIISLQPWIEAKIRRCGVGEADVPDVRQEVLFAAHRASQAGDYRPDTAQEPADALKAWIFGFCWRLASHHRQKAWVRREIPSGLDRCSAVDPCHRLEARSDLLALRHLGRNDRAMLIARADRDPITQLASERGMPRLLAARRIRRSRRIVDAIIRKGAR
jgi:DNA-directed RNA polymerase specialized sigma24 family protein